MGSVDDPERIIERMERLVAETEPEPGETEPIDDLRPIAKQHREAVRSGTDRDGDH